MAHRLLTIALRIQGGWRYNVPNMGKETCDLDGAGLWIAPHGGIYCDRVHEGAMAATAA